MTINDATRIIRLQKTAFPGFYRSFTVEDVKESALLMASMFEDVSADIVMSAVRAFIKADTKGFPPSIGQISEIISHRFGHETKSETSAWEQVRRALKNSLWESSKEFNKLDPLSRRAIGSPETLKEWGLADTAEVETVISSNFQRSYRAELEKEKKMGCLNHMEKAALGISIEEAPVALLPEKVKKTMDDQVTPLSQEEIDRFIEKTMKMAKRLREDAETKGTEIGYMQDPGADHDDFDKKRKRTLQLLSKMKEGNSQ